MITVNGMGFLFITLINTLIVTLVFFFGFYFGFFNTIVKNAGMAYRTYRRCDF